MKSRTIILSIVAVIILAGCKQEETAERISTENKGAVKVETIIATESAMENNFTYSGTVAPSLRIPISFQLPGQVMKIYVEEGDQVRKGDLLAQLDKASVENAYLAAEAAQKQAQDAYERLKKVYDNGSLAEIKWEEIKSKVEQANSMAKISRQNLDNCSITAPTDGYIGSRNVEVGENILPNISILELVKIEEVFIKISVPEKEISWIEKGQTAQVVISAIGSESHSANVEKIGIIANPISKTYEVKLRLENPGFKIKPGMVCDVEMQKPDNKIGLSIPLKAIQRDNQGNTFIFKIEEGSEKGYVFRKDKKPQKVKKQAVEVGDFSNNEIQILSGLAAGEVIIVEGQHKLTDNSLVIL